MDALRSRKQTDHLTLRRTGCEHACGHDSICHGTRRRVLLLGEKFPGKYDSCPTSEEVADSEGLSGAPRMIADGAMEAGYGDRTMLKRQLLQVRSYKAGPAQVGWIHGTGVIGKGGHAPTRTRPLTLSI